LLHAPCNISIFSFFPFFSLIRCKVRGKSRSRCSPLNFCSVVDFPSSSGFAATSGNSSVRFRLPSFCVCLQAACGRMQVMSVFSRIHLGVTSASISPRSFSSFDEGDDFCFWLSFSLRNAPGRRACVLFYRFSFSLVIRRSRKTLFLLFFLPSFLGAAAALLSTLEADTYRRSPPLFNASRMARVRMSAPSDQASSKVVNFMSA